MPRICLDTPIPSMNSIMSMFSPLLTFPPAFPSIAFPDFTIPSFPELINLTLPKFPGIPAIPGIVLDFLGLPNPLFGGLRMPNIEFSVIAAHLQSFQLMQTIMNMVKPLIQYLGMAIEDWLPEIPYLPGFTLIDLLSGNTVALVNAIKQLVIDKVQLPFLPWPIYGSLSMPLMEVTQMYMAIVSNYMQAIVTAMQALIKQVTDKLKIAAMMQLPEFPSVAGLVEMLKSAVMSKIAALNLPDLSFDIPSFEELQGIILPKIKAIPGMLGLPSLDFATILSSLTFPGFPAFPMLPDPLIPAFNIPSLNITMGVKMIMDHLSSFGMKLIMDFIENTLKQFLSFSFPLFCIDL